MMPAGIDSVGSSGPTGCQETLERLKTLKGADICRSSFDNPENATRLGFAALVGVKKATKPVSAGVVADALRLHGVVDTFIVDGGSVDWSLEQKRLAAIEADQTTEA